MNINKKLKLLDLGFIGDFMMIIFLRKSKTKKVEESILL